MKTLERERKKKRKRFTFPLLMLFVLSLSHFSAAQEGVIYIKVVDVMDDFEDSANIYQKDNLSVRYVKTVNISQDAPFTMGLNHGYQMNLNPGYHTVLSDPGNPEFISLWIHYLRYWMLGLGVIFIMVIGIWSIRRYY